MTLNSICPTIKQNEKLTFVLLGQSVCELISHFTELKVQKRSKSNIGKFVFKINFCFCFFFLHFFALIICLCQSAHDFLFHFSRASNGVHNHFVCNNFLFFFLFSSCWMLSVKFEIWSKFGTFSFVLNWTDRKKTRLNVEEKLILICYYYSKEENNEEVDRKNTLNWIIITNHDCNEHVRNIRIIQYHWPKPAAL